MVRLFVLLLTTLGLGWLIADVVKQHGPGYVLIYFNHYSLETSVWVGALLLLAFVALCYLFTLLIRYLFQFSLFTWRFRTRQQRQWFEKSVAFMLVDDFQKAMRFALKNQKDVDLLWATKIALAAQQVDKARELLKRAAKIDGIDVFALTLLHYDIALADKQEKEAQQLLVQLIKQNNKHPALLLRMAYAYCQPKYTQELLDLLPLFAKSTDEMYQASQNQALSTAGHYLIQQALQQNNADMLQQTWFHLSKTAARNSILPSYCEALLLMKKEKHAEKLITTRLNSVFDEACILVYAQLKLAMDEQLQFLQLLDKQYPLNYAISLAIGIVNLRHQQWSQAQQAINASIAIKPTQTAYRYLAEYFQHTGNEKQANKSLLQALTLTA